MTPVHPEFVPDPTLSHEEMEQLQRELADEAVFEDAFDFDPAEISATVAVADDTAENGDSTQTTLGDSADEKTGTTDEADGTGATDETEETDSDPPIVAGVDQAFVDAFSEETLAVSAIVAARGGEVIEKVHAVEPTEIPYIPGLLSFREGGAILAAFEELSVEPDLALLDGSGRIHFRQAGIATHVGVTLDVPTIGVAKSLLCGHPRESLDDPLPEGTRVAIEADDSVDAPEETVIGYAYQSRQYDNPATRHVNPLYVSPGHRVNAETTTDLVAQLCAGYKLPEPTRLADSYADEVKAEIRD